MDPWCHRWLRNYRPAAFHRRRSALDAPLADPSERGDSHLPTGKCLMVDEVPAEPIVAVVVLNWMRADMTLRCLSALAGLARDHRTYVLDNGSEAGSAVRIAQG